MNTQNQNSIPISHQRFKSLHSFGPDQQAEHNNSENYSANRFQNSDSARTSNYNLNEYNENNITKPNSNLSVDEFKGMLGKELRSHFQALRGELMENFSSTIREYSNSYKIGTG